MRRSGLPTGLATGPKSRVMVCVWCVLWWPGENGLKVSDSMYYSCIWFGELKLKIESLN